MSTGRVNPKLIDTVSGVLNAAMAQGNREAYSLAFVLESAGLLQSPESAAEYEAMATELSGLGLSLFEEERDTARLRLALASAKRGRRELRARVAELEAAAGSHTPDKGDHVRLPNGEIHRVARTWASGRDLRVELDNGISRFAAAVTIVPAPVEDPHDSPLHHEYRLGRDLGGACNACGDGPALWCPDCAACRQGCHGGYDDNPCTHPHAPWGGAS